MAGTSVQLQCVRESMSMDKLKIVIELHEGEKSTKKVWRFNVAEHNPTHYEERFKIESLS